MTLLDRLVMYAWPRLSHDVREFVIGQGAVRTSDIFTGHPTETFSPAEYGNYIATSNGVYACATLRATLLSSIPLKVFRLDSQGERTEITAGNLVGLLQKVNPYWTFNRLIEMTELSLSLWGKAFWFLERGQSRTTVPREIWWARPDRVRVFPHQTEYVSHFEYRPLDGGLPIRFERSEVIWFRYPNPLDEFEGLSPLAAARLAADVSSAAMHSNRNIFTGGNMAGGFIMPPVGKSLGDDEARDLEGKIDQRVRGVDRAHRWAVFKREFVIAPNVNWSPKDAEFLGALKWSLEDICRAYKVPLDLVGGERSYDNVGAAMEAVWTQAVLPEARFIANEIVEQLLPMFPGQGALVEFDASDVSVLQEAESEAWQREMGQLDKGAITVNEWRSDKGMEPLPWGDVWWAPFNLSPVVDAERVLSLPSNLPQPEPDERKRHHRQIEFASQQHTFVWNRFIRRTERLEGRVANVARSLFERQRDSVLTLLRKRGARSPDDAFTDPFNLAQWIRTFREEMRPTLLDIILFSGNLAMEDLALDLELGGDNATVLQFLEGRVQRFAQQVNDTTWNLLKDSLGDGIANGESIPELAERVEDVMGNRIRSDATTIARTETISAFSGGTQIAWEESGVVEEKEWLSALDERVRETHLVAHGQRVALDADFEVGSGFGPGPGLIDDVSESVNCRCTMIPVISERVQARNGNNVAELRRIRDLLPAGVKS